MPTPMQYGLALQAMGQQPQQQQPMQPLMPQMPQTAQGQGPMSLNTPPPAAPQQQANPLQQMLQSQVQKQLAPKLQGLFGGGTSPGAAAAPQYYSATNGGDWG